MFATFLSPRIPTTQSPHSSSTNSPSSSFPTHFNQTVAVNPTTVNSSAPQETVVQTGTTAILDTSTQPTNVAILPLLILPLNVSGGYDQAALTAATTSLIGQIMSHLRSGLTVLPAVSSVRTQVPSSTESMVFTQVC